MDEPLNRDGVSFVPGYEERLKGLVSKEKSVISLLHLLLQGDSASRPKVCPPLQLFFLLKVIFPSSSARFLCLTLCCFRTPMGSRDAIYQSPISQQVCTKLLLVVEGDLSAQPFCH